MSVALAALSAAFYGVADFSGGLATRRAPVLRILLISQTAGAVLALAFVVTSGQRPPAIADLSWGFVAGACGVGGLALLYRGIAEGLVALVSPIAALVGAAIPVVFGMLAGEQPRGTALAGAALCIPAILLLSWERPNAGNRAAIRMSLFYGITSGVFIGAFFIALARTSPGSGLWPVLAARVSSIPLVLAAALISRQRISLVGPSTAPAVAAGLADMGANILFLLSARAGLLSIAALVTSLYPAPTVLLARIVFRERVSTIRALGMSLAIAGVALISLG